jgi:hypothetical protein
MQGGGKGFIAGNYSLCALVSEANDNASEVLGESGELAVEWHESYSFSYHTRSHARFVDIFVFSFSSLVMLERFAAVQTAARFVEDWLAAIQKAKAIGSGALDGGPSSFTWARLQPAELLKAMAVTSISWKTAENRFGELANTRFTWIREGEEETVHFGSNASLLLNAQLVMLARSPSSVREAEAADFLPEPGV